MCKHRGVSDDLALDDDPHTGRLAAAIAVGAGVMALAASSAQTSLWTNPERSTPTGTVSGDAGTGAISSPASGGSEWPEWIGVVLNLVAITFFAAVALAAAAMAFGMLRGRTFEGFGRRFTLRRPGTGQPLGASSVTIDAASARTALLGGRPRNAIVACWMQLERDAGAAGLPRLEAETSAEYAARVMGEATGNVVPVDELAELYREARFSRHELDDSHRARAVDALEAVIAELAPTERVSA